MNLWMNSKNIKQGDIFLVDKQNKKYVNDAIMRGASKIVTELDEEYSIDTIKVDSIKAYLKENYDKYIKNLKLIGVTGTNGKTTTCNLIYQMFNNQNIKTAYVGTLGFYYDNVKKELNNTTPSMDELYNLLKEAYLNGCLNVVLEVSSHALKQDRTCGLNFDGVIVTNITQDHLDYHTNMDDYVKQKKKIISMLKNNKICILNANDKYYKEFINDLNNNIIVGQDLNIEDIKYNIDNTKVSFEYNNKIYEIELSLIGKFNVYNFLDAYLMVDALGCKNILKNSKNYKEPKGRMQRINYIDNAIFIDYAHTPDAVLNVLNTVNEINNNGVITILGCGGNRDKTKRDKMANVACNNSNYVIFTNDNPRFEDEKDIISDMLKGASGNYKVIYDRYDAIKKGIDMLDFNNILMILGKGHEDYQIIGDTKYHFSDEETVIDILKKKKK